MKTPPILPPFEERAEALLSRVFGGMHHVYSLKKFPGPSNAHWTCIHHGPISTFDFDQMTRLVFAAHELCLRVQVSNGGPHALKIWVHERTGRDGHGYERHPDITEALGMWNSR